MELGKLKPRHGFALSDLLAMLALVAVAISTLLPALQSIRERTRKEECVNRLREIAFGTHLFHSVNQRLPSTLGATGAVHSSDWHQIFLEYQHTSALAQIAPFMGLAELFDDVDPLVFDFDNNLLNSSYTGTSDFWFNEESGARSLIQDLDEFACPSDSINKVGGNALFFGSIYTDDPTAGDFISIVAWLENAELASARTNYTGCTGAGAGGLNRLGGEVGLYTGAIGWREPINFFTLPDGMSNTVMFGENLGTIQVSVDGEYQRDFSSFWFMGAVSRMRSGVRWMDDPPHDRTNGVTGFFSIFNAANPEYPDPASDPDPRQGILGHANYARTYGFASMHPAGVNFVFIDGSVRTVGRTDDWQSLYAIAGGFDGVDDFELARPGN